MSTPYLPHNPSLKQSRLRQLFEMAPKDAINLGLGQPGEDTPGFIREGSDTRSTPASFRCARNWRPSWPTKASRPTASA
ncbi:MAG: hypothetical protein RL177_531 [Bacteroidota bacterium]